METTSSIISNNADDGLNKKQQMHGSRAKRGGAGAVDDTNRQGFTSLMRAAYHGDLEQVVSLVKADMAKHQHTTLVKGM